MKIAKHKLKRIGVILIVAFLMFSNNFLINVSAKSKVYINDEELFKHFVKKSQVSTDFYTLTLKSRKDTKGNPMVFNIKINGKKSDYTISAGETINIPTEYTKNDYENNVMTIKLESANYDLYKKAKYVYNGTKLKSITLEMEIVSYDTDSNYITENVDIDISSLNLSSSSQTIDCSTVNSSSSAFNQSFCKAKTNAISAGHSYKLTDENGTFDDKDIKSDLKCSANSTKITVNYKDNKTEYDKQYYQNTSYYYAYSTTTKNLGNYTYEYSPGTITKGDKVSCKITCEEAVTVEYGPPVASKAGLCFEYKVKVTSRVSCGMEEEPNKPIVQTQYCTPSPICVHGKVEYDQGGPSEEYDQCIQECDGGKYSQSCSKKCYNQIYSTSDKTTLTSSYNTGEATKLSFDLNECTTTVKNKLGENNILAQGCYYKNKNGTINWSSRAVTTGDYSTFSARDFGADDKYFGGRWYYQFPSNHAYYKGTKKYDVSSNDGFYRRDTGSGHCSDQCSWEGCDGEETYLNPGYITKDTEKNLEIYEDAVAQCTAAASCETTTATFTISVKYDTTTTAKELNFPYETKGVDSDYVKSPAKGNSKGTGSTLLDYSGCYENEDAKNIYMTEWSFPGTWINNKTGEITFDNKSGTTGWYTESNKFCLPLNIKSVNTDWWNWKVLNDTSKSISTIQTQLNNYSYESTTDSSNGYNIKATTRDFGKFGWNFNIYCFYAVNNEPPCTGDECPSTTTTTTTTITPGEGYTIRTIDTSNMFPNTNTTDTTKNRAIGFNWTSAATISADKNSSYAVDPSKLIETIKNSTQTLYTNKKYLDYSFELSIDDINSIRQYNKKYSYGTWNGNTITKNGVNVYQSNLFRSGTGDSMILDSDSINKLGELGINNENQ